MKRLVRAVTLAALLVIMWSGPAHPVAAPVGASAASTPGALYGVAALSSRDVWAVGVPAVCAASPIHCALIEHWDGARWRVVLAPEPVPLPPETVPHLGWLNAVAALSSRDVWAVGGFPHQTDALHWDGTRWRVVPTPALEGEFKFEFPFDGQFQAVAAVSPRDVWAVGMMAATAPGGGRLP